MIPKMNSAHHENHRDNRDISAFWEGPWRVTAELNEMAQYAQHPLGCMTSAHHHWRMDTASVLKSSLVRFFYLETRQLATATGLDRSRY
jgi:hypothetical protein